MNTPQSLADDMQRGMELHPTVKQVILRFFDFDKDGVLTGACAFGFAALGRGLSPETDRGYDLASEFNALPRKSEEGMKFLVIDLNFYGWQGLTGQIMGLNNGGTSMSQIIEWLRTQEQSR